MRRGRPARARAGLPALAVLVLAGGVLAAHAQPRRPPEEAILAVEEYDAAEARALAEAHGPGLRRLYDDVRRCAPEIDFHRPGIGFRKPRGRPGGAPHLTVWVLVDPDQAPPGGDLGARAAETFRRYGRRLLPRLVARAAERADVPVEGYGLVLTWIGPTPIGGRPVGETLVLFADRPTAAEFVEGTIAPATFLARADVRVFDGEAEASPATLVLEAAAAAPAPGC